MVRSNIWADNLDQAKAFSSFTTSYVDSASLLIESQAARPSVVEAVHSGNTRFLNDTIMYIQNASTFYAVYVTDSSGQVISSYPYDFVGRNDTDKLWIDRVFETGNSYVSDAVASEVTGKPAVYLATPIIRDDRTIGVMVGVLDLYYYSTFIAGAQTQIVKYVYVVNRTGHVMLHTNQSYMDIMQDLSDRPGVQNVLNGQEGVVEQYNPQEDMYKLASYSPIPKYGWGVVISMPAEVAYEPITRATFWFIIFIALVTVLATAIAWLVTTSIVDPIFRLTRATDKIPYGDYHKDLPVARRDEIGDLARAFDRMAGNIRDSQQKIIVARDVAEAQKNRAELYVDIMGHDINNLNQAGLFSLELIEDDPNLTEEQRELIKGAIGSFEGSAGIVENARKIQMIDSEKFYLENMELNDIIERCAREYPRPKGKKVTVNYTRGPEMVVKGTPQLKDVFCNLLGNAMKYSGSEVTIDISARQVIKARRRCYEIEFTDNGQGIPEELKARLFRRFERGMSKEHGKGLGLYIVKMLIEHFGGKVEITDRVPGDYTRGTKILIWMPAAEKGGE
ncbi:ATP-binding protein [Methanocella sp. MCL-LM]|uniref:sensor histidine kinase n=1 Tax=Methanocella sp. MCL-LM TaxID=3412035 RepID=UPI003C78743F